MNIVQIWRFGNPRMKGWLATIIWLWGILAFKVTVDYIISTVLGNEYVLWPIVEGKCRFLAMVGYVFFMRYFLKFLRTISCLAIRRKLIRIILVPYFYLPVALLFVALPLLLDLQCKYLINRDDDFIRFKRQNANRPCFASGCGSPDSLMHIETLYYWYEYPWSETGELRYFIGLKKKMGQLPAMFVNIGNLVDFNKDREGSVVVFSAKTTADYLEHGIPERLYPRSEAKKAMIRLTSDAAVSF